MSADITQHLAPFLPGTPRTVLAPGAVITQSAWPAAPVRSIHVVRIGGAGMSAVARLALDAGLAVTGSESQDGQFLAPLREKGATITVGFSADSVPPDVDLLVVSTAVRADNPEVQWARERGIPVIHRAAALAGLLAGRAIVAVAGTHGKTTTTAMTTLALRAAGADPAWAVGAAVGQLGANAGFGAQAAGSDRSESGEGSPAEGGIAVVEADESDGSLVAFAPRILVLTNFEADHLDFHGTEENLAAVMSAFISRVRETSGVLVACADDDGARLLALRAREAGIATVLYGQWPDADWRIVEDHSSASGAHVSVIDPAGERLELRLTVPGRHNVQNALGALIAASELGADRRRLLAGLHEFQGAQRRFQSAGSVAGTEVIDDYAHHPREVAATIGAARERAAGREVVAVFQPHLFSRTKAFTAEFAEALGLADRVVLLPIYAAREDEDPSITSHDIAALIVRGDESVRVLEDAEAPAAIAEQSAEAGVVLMMGAGDIVELTSRVLDALRDRLS